MVRTIIIAATSAAIALAGGLTIGRTMPAPSVLSVRSVDRAWIADLYEEARSNGECVRLTRTTERNGFSSYWLRSC